METRRTPVEEFIADRIRPRDGVRYWPRGSVASASDLFERAAQARGVSVTRVGRTHLLFFHGARLLGSFDGRETDLVSVQARKAARSARLQQAYLRAAGVATTADAAEDTEGGAEAQPGAAQGSALSLRCYVVGEAVVAAVVRVPRHVVGTGEDPLGTLMATAQETWRKNLYQDDPDPDGWVGHLARQGLDEDSVVEEGRVVFLEELGTAPGAAITVDVLDELGEDLASVAVDAMWAFPGLDVAGVDLRAPRLDSAEGATAVRVDPTCDVREFRYPAYGDDRRVAVSLIDHMKG